MQGICNCDIEHNCICSVESWYEDLWWGVFCNTWLWIAHNNALVEINKFLINDLARSEELLEAARKEKHKIVTRF